MTPIQEDGANTDMSIDDATEALLKRWSQQDEDAEKPSEAEPEDEENTEQDVEESDEDESEDAEEPSDDETEEEESETDEDEEDDEPKSKKTLADNEVVKIKVGDEEIEASVKDLKRLYGQEAALTKKSQAVAAKAKEAEETGAKYVTALDTLVQRARERAEPYAKIDWLVVAKNLSDEELSALRTEAQRVFDDVNFFQQELDSVMKGAEQQRIETLQAQAVEAVKVLKEEIPGWNEKVYDEIRNFATGAGLDSQIVNNLVDPAAIKLLHMAMLYNKGKQAVTKKTNKTPKKLVKSTTSAEVTKRVISNKGSDDANAKLRKSGSIDDATDAFLARWSQE